MPTHKLPGREKLSKVVKLVQLLVGDDDENMTPKFSAPHCWFMSMFSLVQPMDGLLVCHRDRSPVIDLLLCVMAKGCWDTHLLRSLLHVGHPTPDKRCLVQEGEGLSSV